MRNFFKFIFFLIAILNINTCYSKSIEDKGESMGNSRALWHDEVLAPSITVTGAGSLTNFVRCGGAASQSQSFKLSGTDLTNDIVITAPNGYEVSLDNTTWKPSITIAQVSGVVTTTTIYLRLASNVSSITNPSTVTISSGSENKNISIDKMNVDKMNKKQMVDVIRNNKKYKQSLSGYSKMPKEELRSNLKKVMSGEVVSKRAAGKPSASSRG